MPSLKGLFLSIMMKETMSKHGVSCMAWASLPAAFVIQAVTCGMGYSTGIYYFRMREVFKENHLLTSCIGSLQLMMTAIAGESDTLHML